MTRIRVALAIGLALIALAFALTLAHAPLSVARRGVAPEQTLVSAGKPASACQAGETLPRATTALRLSLTAALGSRVTVKVLSGPRAVTHGTTPPGWSDASVTVPVQPLSRTVAPVTVCFALAQMNGNVAMRGSHDKPCAGGDLGRRTPAGSDGHRIPAAGRGLRGGRRRPRSRGASVSAARRAARGTPARDGAGGVFITLSSWLVVKELQ